MSNASRFRATAALAYHSLFPGTARSRISTCSASRDIHPADFAAAVSNLDRHVAADGTLEILFRDALGIAAPILLFRLKRRGFSACRVKSVAEGLLLTAMR